MHYEYQLTLQINDTRENILLNGNFQADAWNLLNEFLEYSYDLLNTKFVRDGMPAALNIKWEQNSDIIFSTKLPSWDDVTVFLHKFRPIGLQSEGTNFNKICNILKKELAHPYFRNFVDQQQEFYSGKRMQTVIKFQSDNVVLNSEKVLNNWLNSFEYHRDKEKRQFIESLHEIFPLDASKVLFLILLSDKTQAIDNIAGLIRVVVGKQKSFEYQGYLLD